MTDLELKLAQKNREESPKSLEELYENLVIRKIRKRYSVNQELAILRQRDIKPTEFAAYDEYVEQCKSEAKEEIK